MFYDLHGEGVKIQIMSDLSKYEGGEDSFREIRTFLKRGDIVGVTPRQIQERRAVYFPLQDN